MAEAKKTKTKPKKRYKNGVINEKPEFLEPEEKTAGPASEKNRSVSVALFSVGVLIALMALIPGTAGWRGVHNFLLGMFGISVWITPVTLIMTSMIIGSDKRNEDATVRAKWGIILTLVLCGAIQIFFVGELPGHGLTGTIKAVFDQGKQLKGGGVMCLPVAGVLLTVFGKVGAQIVAVLGIFTFVLLLTGQGIEEFFQLISKPFVLVGKSLDGLHSVIMGGEFDYGFEGKDDEEDELFEPAPVTDRSLPAADPLPEEPVIHDAAPPEDLYEDDPDYIADAEAFAMLGLDPPPRKRRRKVIPPPPPEPEILPEQPEQKEERGIPDENGFVFDIPLPGETDAPLAEPALPKLKRTGAKKPQTEEPETDDALDMLINRAAGAKVTLSSAKKEDIPDPEPEEEIPAEPEAPLYILPGLDLLSLPDNHSNSAAAAAEMREKADTIVNTLRSFGVEVKIRNIYRGPSITRYEIQPGAGVKVSKIRGLEDDIALSLAAQGVRLEAPIPGKAAVGIEVPNDHKDTVTLREILASSEFGSSHSKLAFAVGKDITGKCIVGDIAKMPHVIIAGTTGSGKSVCTRSIIMSLLYNARPDEVKIILIDPKIVEFKIFDGIPHLLIPIVTEAKKAAGALNWAVNEMMRRYNTFAEAGANDLRSYNEIAEEDDDLQHMPQIVIFIDELADMMLVAGKEVEDSICRLAQMGRAAGMHLVVATQRPTTDVITGLIKANIPSRIALSVMSQVDSRTIIDMGGADKLLGNGDMLYMPIGIGKPVRVQGCFASTKDINETLKFIKAQQTSEYDSNIIAAVDSYVPQTKGDSGSMDSSVEAGSDEDYILRAAEVAVNAGQLSTSMLQRKLKLGYARAARIMDELEDMGIIGESEGAKPRRVLMSKMQFDDWKLRRMGEDI